MVYGGFYNDGGIIVGFIIVVGDRGNYNYGGVRWGYGGMQ